MNNLAPDVAELLTWHSEVAEDNLYNDRVRRIHRMTVDALVAFAAVTAERDEARQMLADAPHTQNCETRRGEDKPCICWKAGV